MTERLNRIVILLRFHSRRVANFLWKMKMFFRLHAWDGQGIRFSGLKYWKENILNRDPDERYCCNGDMCGCMAAKVRQVFDHYGEAI